MPHPSPHVRHDADRFTDGDRHEIARAIGDAVRSWHPYTPKPRDAVAIERLARHAIGCGEADLRPVELDYIAAKVREAIGF